MQIEPHPPLEVFRLTALEGKLGGAGDFLASVSLNMTTLYMTWLVMGLSLLVFYLATRRPREVPGRLQVVAELFAEAFDKLCRETLGERGRAFLPFIGTIFVFVWLSNLLGLIPGLHEPTKDVNTPVGLAIIVMLTVHISAMRIKGVRKYIAEYFEPYFVIKGVRIPNIFMAPLNFVGEIGKSISLPFRLFGNIFGGAVILLVVAHIMLNVLPSPCLIVNIGLAPFLSFFFGLFVGTVQAFVFTMLSLTYLAVAIAEE